MHESEQLRRLSPPAARAAPPASPRPFPQPDPSLQSPSSVTSLCRVLACKVAAPSFVPGRVIGQKRIDQDVGRRNGGSKNNGPQAIGKSGGGWNTKIHMVAADARTTVVFALSPGHDHDAPHGRALLEELGPMPEGLPLLMDRAYEGNETRQLVLDLGMIPGF